MTVQQQRSECREEAAAAMFLKQGCLVRVVMGGDRGMLRLRRRPSHHQHPLLACS